MLDEFICCLCVQTLFVYDENKTVLLLLLLFTNYTLENVW